MAVSGRKIPGFRDSLSTGSTDDFEVCCDPCMFLGKTVEAKGFCENCQENLCKRCVDAHKSTKASRHHTLLDQPQKVSEGTTAASDDSNNCTEYCNIHKKEVIKFFCSQHNKIGCTDCMTFDHRTCTIDYIPDVCSGTLKNKEFNGTLKDVSKALKAVKALEQKAQLKKTENKTSVEEVIKEIEKFQKKMNGRIEQLKQELVTRANLYKSHQGQEADKISDSCARVYSELKQIHTALTNCQTKQLDTQAFVTMKQAQWILSSTNVQSYEQQLTNVLITLSFEQNSKLENILSQQYGLGTIILPLTYVEKKEKPNSGIGKSTKWKAGVATTHESKLVEHCIKQKTINVRTESDKVYCYINGCAVISADRLLLVDYWNNKLKIVITESHSVVEEMTVDDKPYDVTVLAWDQVAVTLLGVQKILILGTAGKLTRIRNMNVGRQGLGIANHQDLLYVVCRQPNSLLVLDMQGNVQRDIPLQTAQDQTFRFPAYIAVGKYGHTLYISDQKSHFVASLTLHGNVTGIYKQSELLEPRGLVVLEDGSLLVRCYSSGAIHHISADLNGHTLILEVPYVLSICCHPFNRQIYVGVCDNVFHVFNYKQAF